MNFSYYLTKEKLHEGHMNEIQENNIQPTLFKGHTKIPNNFCSSNI